MCRILSLVCLSVVSVSCGRFANDAHTVSMDSTPVFYERFTAGDPVTDQSAATDSFSTLIGTYGVEDANVRDDDFASDVAARALSKGASLYFVLNQCYSGGFMDNLASLGGTQSFLSSARHSETASYAYEPPTGVDLDSTDTFIQALGDGTAPAEAVAREAVALNPFGPNPDAQRLGEEVGSEHAQFNALGGGDGLKVADHARTGMAVLWAGQPAERDGVQMNLMIERLVAMGYARDRIWLFYGGGEAHETHPIVRAHMMNPDDEIHLLAATRANLFGLFAQTFEGKKQGEAPSFVFLYVGDHGGLDEAAVAKTNFGRPDALITPVLDKAAAGRIYGEGFDVF